MTIAVLRSFALIWPSAGLFFYPQTLRFVDRIRLPWQAFKRLCSGRAAIERDDLAG